MSAVELSNLIVQKSNVDSFVLTAALTLVPPSNDQFQYIIVSIITTSC